MKSVKLFIILFILTGCGSSTEYELATVREDYNYKESITMFVEDSVKASDTVKKIYSSETGITVLNADNAEDADLFIDSSRAREIINYFDTQDYVKLSYVIRNDL